MAVQVGIVKTLWSGLSGGPGITQIAVCTAGEGGAWDGTKAQTAVNAVRAFFAARPSTLPNELTLTVDPTVDIFGIVTGNLEESFSAATSPAAVVGTNAGSFSMASGAKINFKTAGIKNNRRIRGGLFIVPCAGDVFDTNGTISSTPRTNWLTDANALRTALVAGGLEHVVWSRPSAKGANDGSYAAVTSYDVPTKGGILRGRRG
jgi:hypothetical protein